MAACYLTNKYFPQAIQAYQLLAQLDPQDPWPWHNTSIAHIELKQVAGMAEPQRVRQALCYTDWLTYHGLEIDLATVLAAGAQG